MDWKIKSEEKMKDKKRDIGRNGKEKKARKGKGIREEEEEA